MSSHRSRRRLEARSKFREALQRQQREILEEFCMDPDEEHTIINIPLTREREDRATFEALRKSQSPNPNI